MRKACVREKGSKKEERREKRIEDGKSASQRGRERESEVERNDNDQLDALLMCMASEGERTCTCACLRERDGGIERAGQESG